MNIKGKAAAFLILSCMFCQCTAMAASYDAQTNTVSADDDGSYQTVLVTNTSADTFYYMDTVKEGLSTVMNLRLIGTELEPGNYILRLKSIDGAVSDQMFIVGDAVIPSDAVEAVYAGDGNEKTDETGQTKTVSKGYYITGSFGGAMTVYVQFTYDGEKYTYSEVWDDAPVITDGTIGIQINGVPADITDMKVMVK